MAVGPWCPATASLHLLLVATLATVAAGRRGETTPEVSLQRRQGQGTYNAHTVESTLGGKRMSKNACRHPLPCFLNAPWDELSHAVDIATPESTGENAARTDPLWVSSKPGQFQLSGMQGGPSFVGWTAVSSRPAKTAVLRSTKDAREAVLFARKHSLAVAVKNTGHEWFGRNAVAGGGHLELWTHPLNSSTWSRHFTPAGCTEDVGHVVTLGAGVQHWQLYDEATANQRTVTGGTCSTVGVVGAGLGGGYGDYSRMYGSIATNLVQAKAVLADGRIVTASSCNKHRDLFRALRGGGSGFALVTEATYRTHPAMADGAFGDVSGRLEGDFAANMGRLLTWYRDIVSRGFAKHFGGKIFVYHDMSPPRIFIEVQLKFNGLEAEACSKLLDPLRSSPNPIDLKCISAENPWKPQHLVRSAHGAPGWMQEWERDSAGSYWLESFTRYITERDLETPRLHGVVQMFQRIAETLGANEWQAFLTFSLNYGLGGGSPTALAWTNQTTVHPQVRDAVSTVKLTRRRDHFVPESPAHFEDSFWENLRGAREALNSVLPEAGSYFQEGDYSDLQWSSRYWGSNYPELLATKRKYDPSGFFQCHQCVGSETI